MKRNLFVGLKNENFINCCIIILLVLFNIILKSIYLTTYNIDLDEPFTLFHSQQSFQELIQIFKWENNPPLYFVVLHFWIKLFGIGVLSARILPLVFSSLAVVYIFLIGRRFLNLRIAISTCLLYTFSNVIIMEAHDCRVYSLFVLLTVASMYFYFSLLNSEKKQYNAIFLTICNILLVYSHFLAFFVILLQFIYTIYFSSIRKKNLKIYLLSSFLLLASYLPYIFIFISRFSNSLQVGIHTPKIEFFQILHSYLETFGNGYIAGSIFLILLIYFMCTYILTKKITLSIYEKMILGWFFVTYLILFLVSFKFQVLSIPRYLIFLIPGFCFSLTIAIYHLTKKNEILNYLSLGICIILMNLFSNLNYSNKLESQKMVSYVTSIKNDSTLVYIAPPWIDKPFLYHYNINAFKDYNNYLKFLNDDNIYILSSAYDIDISKLKDASQIILIEGWNGLNEIDPDNEILNTFDTYFNSEATQIPFWGYRIYQYTQ